MAACDFGICQTGEALYECYGMQLPVLASDCMSWIDSYRTLGWNVFGTDFNRHVIGEHIPELVAMNSPQKVTELWSEWMVNPQAK